MVHLHGSKVRFHSNGAGCGTRYFRSASIATTCYYNHRQHLPNRFFFTLPSFKKIPLESQESNSVSPAVIEPEQPQSFPSNPFKTPPKDVRVYPESSDDDGGAPAVMDDRFSHIAPRSLHRPGVCKVLVVDDSAFNVKIMKNILKKVSTTWRCLSPVPTDTATDQGGVVQRLLQTDRSQAYMVSDTASSPTITNGVSSSAVVLDLADADDGAAALQMVQAASEVGSPYDVVFMDNIMVVMHGPEAAQAMRAAGFRGLIVGVTGNVMPDDVRQYMGCGANHVLGKPVNIEDVKQILQRLT